MSASIEQIWNIVASRKSMVKKAVVPEKGPYGETQTWARLQGKQKEIRGLIVSGTPLLLWSAIQYYRSTD